MRYILIVWCLLSSMVVADELDLLNAQRAKRGLHALIRAPVLEVIAEERLQMNVERGHWGHFRKNGRLFGRFKPAIAEGCGCTTSPDKWHTCFRNTKRFERAGAAMQKVGDRFWQILLLR